MLAQQEQYDATAASPMSPESYHKAVVVKAHKPTDNSQLDLKEGDTVYVLEKDASGWWGGHKEGEDNTGWFPGNCVEEVAEIPVTEMAPLTSSVGPEPEAEDLNPADCAAGTTSRKSGQSPLWHQGSSVASPQRRTSEGGSRNQTGRVAAAAHRMEADIAVADQRELSKLQETVDRLKEENRQLHAKGEALASAEREKAVYLEEKLRAAEQERERAESNAKRLQQELQREKRTSQVRQREAEETRMQFEQIQQQLADKNAEMERSKAAAEANERAAQENAKAAAARAAELEHTASVYRAAANEAEQANSILAEEGNETLRRRLFPSTFQGQQSPSVKSYRAEVASSPPGTDERLGRQLAPPLNKPPEVPRVGTSPWRTAGGRPAAAPASHGSMARVGSSDHLSACATSKLATARVPRADDEDTATRTHSDKELPPRGVVAEKVMAFEKRCATPQRGASETRGSSVTRSASASSQRYRHETSTSASVSAAPSWRFSTQVQSTTATRAETVMTGFSHLPPVSTDLHEADDCEVVLGMSPLHRR